MRWDPETSVKVIIVWNVKQKHAGNVKNLSYSFIIFCTGVRGSIVG
jgi:hypothetical protein